MSALLTIIVALVVSIAAIIVLTRYLNLHAFFSLLIAAVICGLITNIPVKEIIALMQEGFGLLLRQIGFLVALGSCLGMMLEKTGGMEVISKKVVGWFGAKRSTLALSFTGIVVGIPVFCDSGFIILSRLIPSIAAQTSILPAELSLALSTGLYTTHTLVPPTPGPLAAAVNLGLEDRISIVMLIGIVASLPVGLVAYFFSKRLAKGMITSQGPIITERSNVNAWLAFAPLILPLVLIALSVNPIVALAIGVGLSFLLIKKKSEWPAWLSEALKDAGIILLITGAGGSFGAVIKASGIDSVLKEYVSGSSSQGIIFLVIGFVIAAALKTAQGSTTTSMIITSGLLVPLLGAAGFDTTTELAALLIAIAGGAMTVSHANDSYFWVVSQFGGIAAKDALRSFTLLTGLQGLTALVMSILVYLIL